MARVVEKNPLNPNDENVVFTGDENSCWTAWEQFTAQYPDSNAEVEP